MVLSWPNAPFGDVTDFVLNGALPSAVTQAEVIANPSNTVYARHSHPGRT